MCVVSIWCIVRLCVSGEGIGVMHCFNTNVCVCVCVRVYVCVCVCVRVCV